MKESFKKRLTRYIEKTSVLSDGPERTPPADDAAVQPSNGSPAPADEDRLRRIQELRSRLGEIVGKRGRADEAPKEPVQADLATAALEKGPIPGAMIPTDRGPVWEHETRIDLGDRYGGIYLLDAMSFDGEVASLLGMDEAYGAFDPRRAVYLDTETTGLELATATIPFLIGLGFVDGQQLVVRQVFIDRIEKEAQILRYVGDLLEGRSQLVTFNGKTYDVPLLKTRCIFNRLETDIEHWLDLDLLHIVRRIYKRRIQDCSLVSCEKQVLGFLRENDIPGEMIPGVFVSYLRDDRPGLLPLVFHHNQQDIVAMLGLMGSLALLARSRPEAFGEHSPDDLLSIARLGARQGRKQQAQTIWDYARGSCGGNRKVESLLGLAKLARKRQDFKSAARLLELALEEEPTSPQIHLMLSKIFEHDVQDFEKALKHATGACGAEDDERWSRRLRRLERKIEKARGESPGS
jgi:uncharacterized protein YprB with RNaseH-like and TPR domain